MQAHPFILAAILPLAGCISDTRALPSSNPQAVYFADEIEVTADGACFGRGARTEPVALSGATPTLPQVSDASQTASLTPVARASDANPTAPTSSSVTTSEAFETVMASVETADPLDDILLIPDENILYFMGIESILPGRDTPAAAEGARFAALCPADYTPSFISDLQRALKVRDTYEGPISGLMDAQTRDAIQTYQRAQGLDSAVIGRDTARDLGLVALTPDERAAAEEI